MSAPLEQAIQNRLREVAIMHHFPECRQWFVGGDEDWSTLQIPFVDDAIEYVRRVAFIALWFTRPIIDALDVVSVPYAPVVALVASESLLFVVSFVASLGPVRRAAQADPLEIIRAI